VSSNSVQYSINLFPSAPNTSYSVVQFESKCTDRRLGFYTILDPWYGSEVEGEAGGWEGKWGRGWEISDPTIGADFHQILRLTLLVSPRVLTDTPANDTLVISYPSLHTVRSQLNLANFAIGGLSPCG
jgi:hypothetical protein